MSSRRRGYRNINDVTIKFETEYVVENADSMCLAVSGSTPELGRWNVADCKLAREHPRGSGRWSVSVVMGPDEQFQWKWILVVPDRTNVIRWEEIANREQNSGTESRIIFAGWNEAAEVLPYEQREAALPFPCLPPFSVGINFERKEFASFRRGYVVRGSKQEVTTVVFLCKTDGKTWRCTHAS